ncbi:hypothetical protein SGQ83_08005 [Flavobacterium sp. Fl-318]|uniref:Transporter n=1 Tax=Flavobacterium cupriresistens TaxID=2893885 RepID=A0ABU4R9P8_9FLAO|nr:MULTISPECIES: hypothetical protein [unclassified Flavobacterium]MDX6189284.1 hypothetical protein [Flavobacterium sp. Fl-318]UFH41380.1 hypothetical protein LNP23_16375 [Flavobacterium sp. F-323]
MKFKSLLSLLLFLFILKIQAQASINETKRKSSFIETLLSEEYKKLTADIAESNENLKDLTSKLILKNALVKDDIIEQDIKVLEAAKEVEQSQLDLLLEKRDSFIKKQEDQKPFIEYFNSKITEKVVANTHSRTAITTAKTLKEMDEIQKGITRNERDIKILQEQKERRLLNLNTYRWFMPTVRRFDREIFFQDMYNNSTDKTILLNSLVLNSNSNATAVQTEIVTDNLSALRLSFGSVLSLASSEKDTGETEQEQKQAETEQEALSRLVNGGGNFYLEAILPVLCTNPNNGNQFTFYGYANARGAMDIDGLGNDIDTATGNYSFGLNTYFGLSSDSKKFNFFLQANGNVTGGTKEFYRNLGLANEKIFFNGKVIAGMTILNNFRLSATLSNYGSDQKIRSNKITVGVQILPGF